MNSGDLGAAEYEAKFAREALADARARGASPQELAPLMRRDSDARRKYSVLFHAALKRQGLDINNLPGEL